MIVAFSVDPDALPMKGVEPPVMRSAHTRLLARWLHLGLLVYAGSARFGETTLYRAICDLPQDVRKRWQVTAKYARLRAAPQDALDLAQILESQDLKPFSGHVHLACLHEARADLLGLPDGRHSVHLSDVDLEICRFDCADQAEHFVRAADLAVAPIGKDRTVAEVWRERFASFAATARNVVLIDRWSVDGLIKRGSGSGLRRLLVNLDGESRKILLRVFASCEDHEERALTEALSKATDDLSRGGIREVKAFLVPTKAFQRISHPRSLRFDEAVCRLDIGIELLQGEKLWRECEFQMRLRQDADREREKDLETAADGRVWVWKSDL